MTVQSQSLTLNHVTVAMNEAVQQYPSLCKKINAVIQFIIDNDDDANDNNDDQQNQSANSIVVNATKEQHASRQHGAGKEEQGIQDPDLVLRTKLVVLQNLLQKVITPQKAFMKGEIKIVKGKLSLAMKLSYLLDATRKVLLIQHSKSKL